MLASVLALLGLAVSGQEASEPQGGGAVPRRDVVRIGSKTFPESHLLGEMMALVIEAHTDLRVEHESGLGGTLVCFTALQAGDIDVYPDYTGTGWSIVLKEAEKITDPLRTFLHVQQRYRERYDVEWLSPFGFNNGYALAMRSAHADELGVRSLSDLAAHAAELTAGFSVEFVNREDGYAGLSPFYGFELGEVRGMEHALAYEAVVAGSVDLVDAYTTDAKLLRYELRALEDDRAFFPPYDAAPLVRGELLRTHPEVGEALGRLAFAITAEAMTALNYAVEVDRRPFREVAREFLEGEGILEGEGVGQESGEARRADGFLAFLVGRRAETARLTWQHLQLVLSSVFLASFVAVPLGIWITRRRWAERVSLGLAGAVQTIPSLALLAFMIAVPGLGLSFRSAVLALTLYAVLPILRNTFTGVRSVDADLVDAARGMGLSERQILVRVQLPLATGTIMAGVRTATVITIGFATLAAFIGAGGLGEPILMGLYLNDTSLILAGALPAAVLAIGADAVLGVIERRLTPRGLRRAGG